MGSIFSKQKEARLLVLGLDNAGKSSNLTLVLQIKLSAMVSHLKSGEYQQTVPTVGFNVETVKFKNLKLNLWDVGGQDTIRPLWKHYYTAAKGLIFVVDSTDVDRFSVAKNELSKVLEDDEMKNVLVLLLANKQDLDNAVKPKELSTELNLESLVNHKWVIMPMSAKTGDGINEAFDWLVHMLKTKKK